MMNPKVALRRFGMVQISPDGTPPLTHVPQIICADPNGMPFLEGQAFYTWLIDKRGCQPDTATTYLKSVLQFLTFLWLRDPPLPHTAAVTELRDGIEAYLREKLTCVIRPHRAGNLLIIRSKTVTPQTARLHLTALKRFYDFLIWAGKYPETNPLIREIWQALRDQAATPAGFSSAESSFPKRPAGRLPATYFCVTANEWRPKIIDDPALPQQLVAAMTHPRDQIIVRMLFESGARINEILSLTVDDWRYLWERRHGARAINKGSRGQQVKEIWWSNDTNQILRHLVQDGASAAVDPQLDQVVANTSADVSPHTWDRLRGLFEENDDDGNM